MANNKIFFENPKTGQMKVAPIGFSWTTMCFGPIPMLFRGSWKWFAIEAIIWVLTGGFSTLVFMFIINKLHAKDLINDGYKATRVEEGSFKDMSARLGVNLPPL